MFVFEKTETLVWCLLVNTVVLYSLGNTERSVLFSLKIHKFIIFVSKREASY